MRYRIEASRSRFTVHATSGGMLSMLAHNPTFEARDFSGTLRWQPDSERDAGFDMTIRADSLKLTDEVRPVDRDELEGRMRREVLEVMAFPEIAYSAREIATTATTATTAATAESGSRYRLRLLGALALHGVAKPLPVQADLVRYDDGVRMQGEAALQMSDFRMRPVTALGGAIQLRDSLKLAFDLVLWQEA